MSLQTNGTFIFGGLVYDKTNIIDAIQFNLLRSYTLRYFNVNAQSLLYLSQMIIGCH